MTIIWVFMILNITRYQFQIRGYVGGLQDHRRLDDTGRTHRSRHVVVLVAVICYGKDTRQNQLREKARGVKPRETRCKLPRVLSHGSHKVSSHWSHGMHLIPPAMTTHVKYCLPGQLRRGSALRDFYWGRSCRPPLPRTYQNSSLPGGKQVFSRNHIVCTGSLGTLLPVLEWGDAPKPRILHASQGPTL